MAGQKISIRYTYSDFAARLSVEFVDDPGWQAERGIGIAGIGCRESLEIGARFGQNDIVVGELGGVAELVFCDPAA